MIAEQLGAELTRHRATLGLSRRALARRLKVAPTTLRDLELGLDNPTAQRIDAVLAELNLEPVLTLQERPK